jgi:hypothetical protein
VPPPHQVPEVLQASRRWRRSLRSLGRLTPLLAGGLLPRCFNRKGRSVQSAKHGSLCGIFKRSQAGTAELGTEPVDHQSAADDKDNVSEPHRHPHGVELKGSSGFASRFIQDPEIPTGAKAGLASSNWELSTSARTLITDAANRQVQAPQSPPGPAASLLLLGRPGMGLARWWSRFQDTLLFCFCPAWPALLCKWECLQHPSAILPARGGQPVSARRRVTLASRKEIFSMRSRMNAAANGLRPNRREREEPGSGSTTGVPSLVFAHLLRTILACLGPQPTRTRGATLLEASGCICTSARASRLLFGCSPAAATYQSNSTGVVIDAHACTRERVNRVGSAQRRMERSEHVVSPMSFWARV